jgi:hypothetical protein
MAQYDQNLPRRIYLNTNGYDEQYMPYELNAETVIRKQILHSGASTTWTMTLPGEQLFPSFSAAFPQLFHSFSAAFPQLGL